MGDILLVWEAIPESTDCYIIKQGTNLAELAFLSAGKYINGDDLEEGDPIYALSEQLSKEKSVSMEGPIVGPFSAVVVCGFLM